MSVDDSDIFHCYVDLWKSASERINMAYQCVGKANMLKHRVGAGNASTDAEDQAIAGAFKNRVCIPLDFELLETHMPLYQAGLGDRLEYELTFNDYNKVINATDADSSYKQYLSGIRYSNRLRTCKTDQPTVQRQNGDNV